MSITTFHSNLRFLLPPHSAASTTTTFSRHTSNRCGRRDNRGPLVKGRTLSIEAIQAVQYLKRLHRTTTTTTSTTDLRSTARKTLSRLIKADLLTALRELLRQDHTTLALVALSILNSEHGHDEGDGPDLSLYADVAAALSRTGRAEEIDQFSLQKIEQWTKNGSLFRYRPSAASSAHKYSRQREREREREIERGSFYLLELKRTMRGWTTTAWGWTTTAMTRMENRRLGSALEKEGRMEDACGGKCLGRIGDWGMGSALPLKKEGRMEDACVCPAGCGGTSLG